MFAIVVVAAAIAVVGLPVLGVWVRRWRSHAPVAAALRTPSRFRVLTDPGDLEEALGRAAAYEEAVADQAVRRLARYERMAAGPAVVAMPARPEADTA